MKTGRHVGFELPREISKPTEIGKYRVYFYAADGRLQHRDIWFFPDDSGFAATIAPIFPCRVEGPLPGTRLEEWPKISDAADDCIVELLAAVLDRARKDAMVIAPRTRNAAMLRDEARTFLGQTRTGRILLARIDAEREIKRRKDNKSEEKHE